LLDRELRRLGISEVNQDQLARSLEYRTADDMVVAIGTGDLTMTRLANQLMYEEEDDEGLKFGSRPSVETEIQSHDTIAVVGLKGLLTTIAKCCKPVPGDDIIGYITRGRGATVHRKDCPNILRLRERERLVRVSWGEPKRTYPVSVCVKAYDRDGLIRDITNLIANEGINMNQVQVDFTQKKKLNVAVLDLVLEVREVDQLMKVLTRIEALPNVLEAIRVRPG